MHHPIRCIVGLGNPGPDYQNHRHNAGHWFVHALAADHQLTLRHETKFKGAYGRIQQDGIDCHLLLTGTYMNHSGQSVQALIRYLKIPTEHILIAHDELDLPSGIIRLKQGGGHAGHNGLRDIISQLGSHAFYRLRIGIGHPGDSKKVHSYVLSQPSIAQREKIDDAIMMALRVIPPMLRGDIEQAMQTMHTEKK